MSKDFGFDKEKMYKNIETGQELRGEFVQQLFENARKMGSEDLEAWILLSWDSVDDKERKS